MIAYVYLAGPSYRVMDVYGKIISTGFESSLGELMGYSSEAIIFRKGSNYVVTDKDFDLIAKKDHANLGEFMAIPGDTLAFRRGRQVSIHDLAFKENREFRCLILMGLMSLALSGFDIIGSTILNHAFG